MVNIILHRWVIVLDIDLEKPLYHLHQFLRVFNLLPLSSPLQSRLPSVDDFIVGDGLVSMDMETVAGMFGHSLKGLAPTVRGVLARFKISEDTCTPRL